MVDDSLSALEAGFLHLESAVTPMHVGSVAVCDGAGWHDRAGRLRLRALRAYIAGRLTDLPRLRQVPRWPAAPTGRPLWVDDPDLDVARHVRARRLATPGDEARLLDAVAAIHMERLDRHHPLWGFTFLEGLPGGRVALVERLHHALVDGIGGVDLTMLLLDTAPLPPSARRAPKVPVRSVQAAAPAAADGVADGLASLAREPLAVGRELAAAAAHPLQAATATRQLASAVASVAARPLAPPSSLNAPIGPTRRYLVVRRSLPDARRTAHALHGTVNDVVLAAVTAGFQALLTGRGEPPPPELHALVPVSVRGADEHRALGNRVATLIVPLPVRVTDPGARFTATHRAAQRAKDHHQAQLATAILEFDEHWPEPAVAACSWLVQRQRLVNVVVTNVPGPPVPLYLMGARRLEVAPIVPLSRNLTVSVGVLSYLDQLAVGLWADAGRVPDLPVLAAGIENGFDALDALTG